MVGDQWWSMVGGGWWLVVAGRWLVFVAVLVLLVVGSGFGGCSYMMVVGCLY